jgi:aspartate/methionine/tyrosine aminotransferase
MSFASNPSGRVFTRAELDLIARLYLGNDVAPITDEIYE